MNYYSLEQQSALEMGSYLHEIDSIPNIFYLPKPPLPTPHLPITYLASACIWASDDWSAAISPAVAVHAAEDTLYSLASFGLLSFANDLF